MSAGRVCHLSMDVDQGQSSAGKLHCLFRVGALIVAMANVQVQYEQGLRWLTITQPVKSFPQHVTFLGEFFTCSLSI